MNINIKVIPHDSHRYETVGDWWWEGDDLSVRVSDMKNWKYEFLVVFHELIEVMLCKMDGVSPESVDAFDKHYEDTRSPESLDEPGDNKNAPYYRQHQIATGFERLMATQLGVDWNEYDHTVESL